MALFLPVRRRQKPSIILWALFVSALTVIGMAIYRGYIIVQTGYSLTSVPPLDMAFKVMGLHWYALYGAVAGAIIGLIEKTYYRFRDRAKTHKVDQDVDQLGDTDARIRRVRAKRAGEYLESKKAGQPLVENVVTARSGMFTYRVMAFRHLAEHEQMDLIRQALEDGRLQEPEPGGTATLITDIGAKDH